MKDIAESFPLFRILPGPRGLLVSKLGAVEVGGRGGDGEVFEGTLGGETAPLSETVLLSSSSSLSRPEGGIFTASSAEGDAKRLGGSNSFSLIVPRTLIESRLSARVAKGEEERAEEEIPKGEEIQETGMKMMMILAEAEGAGVAAE
uniref:Uncharacterized protein n=1 Tax=Chromera velia CCMP2878 TaxID=1169474 RepID=A0A0G4HG27_9ALVE|eukprot:Cvel_27241.t1-p1 / transcript=Cvel_27241.t1 / gene=Cvel_27241 / organism=Chromera_velia_CCMP2878 / gene_product=hypothetical protein / transcript_product=hypothetical protein / location=Cvel_scaffold3373:11576-12710(-) / protein_length=146 / sequence_SO=supercontig / SO=protein_coding / is_pseudo=false